MQKTKYDSKLLQSYMINMIKAIIVFRIMAFICEVRNGEGLLFVVFSRLVRVVYEISCKIIVIGRHVDKAVSRKIE